MKQQATMQLGMIPKTSPFFQGWTDFLDAVAGADGYPLPLFNSESLIRPDGLLTLTPTASGGVKIRMGSTIEIGERVEYPFGNDFDWGRVSNSHTCLSLTLGGGVGVVCMAVSLDDGSLRSWVKVFDKTEMEDKPPSGMDASRSYQTQLKLSVIQYHRVVLDAVMNDDASRVLARVMDPMTDEVTTVLLA